MESIKQKFSTIEREALVKRGWDVDDSTASRSSDQFRSSFLKLNEDRTVTHSGWEPTNVDVDDGSYDNHNWENVFQSVSDFVEYKKPIKEKEWTN